MMNELNEELWEADPKNEVVKPKGKNTNELKRN
jgi:hypothetical protein